MVCFSQCTPSPRPTPSTDFVRSSLPARGRGVRGWAGGPRRWASPGTARSPGRSCRRRYGRVAPGAVVPKTSCELPIRPKGNISQVQILPANSPFTNRPTPRHKNVLNLHGECAQARTPHSYFPPREIELGLRDPAINAVANGDTTPKTIVTMIVVWNWAGTRQSHASTPNALAMLKFCPLDGAETVARLSRDGPKSAVATSQ
jgi:hypothetical protein